MVNDLYVRPEAQTILEKNLGSELFEVTLNNIFLDMSSRAGEAKEKMNKWDYIKVKSFCTVKETASKTKRQLTEWEKIFASDTSD